MKLEYKSVTQWKRELQKPITHHKKLIIVEYSTILLFIMIYTE